MDEAEFNELAARLAKVNDVIKQLDPALRDSAFALFEPYVTATPVVEDDKVEDRSDGKPKPASIDEDTLIEKFESDTDHENALLALAIWYSRYGKGPFKMPKLKALATELGLTLPTVLMLSSAPTGVTARKSCDSTPTAGRSLPLGRTGSKPPTA
jgi:hypothetical protein